MTQATLDRHHTIRCGSCKGSHETVLGVKECYTNSATTDTASQARERVARLAERATEERKSVRLDFAAIPDGNYAVRTDGVVKFYRISTNGTWKNVQVRASDTLHRVPFRAAVAILHRIVEAGLEKSQMLFATELGCCWKCGKTLTDETSRALGIGPICRG